MEVWQYNYPNDFSRGRLIPDIWCSHIFAWLDPLDRERLKRVNKSWRDYMKKTCWSGTVNKPISEERIHELIRKHRPGSLVFDLSLYKPEEFMYSTWLTPCLDYLVVLDLGFASIDLEFQDALPRMTQLRMLLIANCYARGDGSRLRPLRFPSQLCYLRTGNNGFKMDKDSFSGCTALTSLSCFVCSDWPEGTLQPLYTTLKRLVIQGMGAGDGRHESLPRCIELQSLSLCMCQNVSDDMLGKLTSLKSLHMLNMNDANVDVNVEEKVTGECFKSLQGIETLRYTDNRSREFCDLDYKNLQDLKSLRELYLDTPFPITPNNLEPLVRQLDVLSIIHPIPSWSEYVQLFDEVERTRQQRLIISSTNHISYSPQTNHEFIFTPGQKTEERF